MNYKPKQVWWAVGWAMAMIWVPFVTQSQQQDKYPYRDVSLPVHERVEDLLARMTLEEKVGQMNMWGTSLRRKAMEELEQGLVGIYFNERDPEVINEVQQIASQSRLGIPLLVAIDAVHGHGKHQGATIFPTPLAMSSSWQPALIEEASQITAREMRATGHHWNFFPNVDVARDPRWGRTGETFGEDPYLVSRFAAAMVTGLQGGPALGTDRVVACIKHFAAGGQPKAGLNFAPIQVGERTLREVYFPPFKAAIDAGAMSLMAAHNEIDGVPCHANSWLLTDVLRGEWGFKGFVSTDWHDIERLIDIHHITDNQKEAVRQAVSAGVDAHMDGENFTEPLAELVREGAIPEVRIDRAVRSILTAKFNLGLFENPIIDVRNIPEATYTKQGQALALKSARESIVLLKNQGSLLPLSKKMSKVFLSGPNAHSNALVGDWIRRQPDQNVVTVREGLQMLLDKKQLDFYDCGDIASISDEAIAEAAQRAKQAEVAILVVGGRSNQVTETWEFDKHRPERTGGENVARANLHLVGKQLDLIKAVKATGTPTVVVLVNNRPLAINWVAENIPAIVEAWEPGMTGGKAIAEVLFGEVNPSGKLTITFPRSAGHIPAYYNHKPSAYYRQYKFGETTPLYPFGHGLSYTQFRYENLSLSQAAIDSGQAVQVSIQVTNTGKRGGSEVTQLYIRDKVSQVTRPVKELIGFQKHYYAAGAQKTLTFRLGPEELAYHGKDMKLVVEPGAYDIMVGGSSESLATITLTVK